MIENIDQVISEETLKAVSEHEVWEIQKSQYTCNMLRGELAVIVQLYPAYRGSDEAVTVEVVKEDGNKGDSIEYFEFTLDQSKEINQTVLRVAEEYAQ